MIRATLKFQQNTRLFSVSKLYKNAKYFTPTSLKQESSHYLQNRQFSKREDKNSKRGISAVEIGFLAAVFGGLGYEFYKYLRDQNRDTTVSPPLSEELRSKWSFLLSRFKDTPAAYSIIALNTAIFLLCKARPHLLDGLMLSLVTIITNS